MNKLKSSADLKADAREQLLGKYKTLILAYVLMQIIISGCLSLVEMQVDLQTIPGTIIYYAVYLILVLLSAIFTVGQNYLYLNIARGKEFTLRQMWYGFQGCADKAISIHLMLMGMSLLCGIPFIVSCLVMVFTKNYYFALLVAASLIFFLIGALLLSLRYSQALFLIIDYPQESAKELMAHSRSLMKGHKGSYFYLLVSFIGIGVLCLCTFGIGMLWAYPYMTATKTNYYMQLNSNKIDIVL